MKNVSEEMQLFLKFSAILMPLFVSSGKNDLSALSVAINPTTAFSLTVGPLHSKNPMFWPLNGRKPKLADLRVFGAAKLAVTDVVFPGLRYIDESTALKFSPESDLGNEFQQLAELVLGDFSPSFSAPNSLTAKDWHKALVAAFWPDHFGSLSREIAFLLAVLDTEVPTETAQSAITYLRLMEAFKRIFVLAVSYHFYLENREYVDRTIRSNLKVKLDGSPDYTKIGSLLSNRIKQENEFLRIDTDDLIAISGACCAKNADSTSSWQDYERTCLQILELSGYQSQLTKTGADYGGDITCIKSERTYVIQCKKLSKAVGISAVQEAVAARIHYAVDFAVVVSESGFTKAASELAERSDTLLTRSAKLNNIEAHWD